MSFSSPRRSSPGGRRGSSTKKVKKKKQDFHTHKGRLQEEEKEQNLEEVRARLMVALDRLGHQVFSAEPGAYSLQNWVSNFNLLLDDFQDRLGPEKVPPELVRERQELARIASSPPDIQAVDAEIRRTEGEETHLRETMEQERRMTGAKLEEVRREIDRVSTQLQTEGTKPASASRPRPLLSRLFGRPSQEESALEENKAELESKLRSLKEEEGTLLRKRAAMGSEADDPASEYGEAMKELEALQARMETLRSQRQAMVQLSKEREEGTARIAAIIAKMQL